MSGILCFSETNIRFLMHFLCTEQKEEDSACVLFMGTALAESPRDHPWLVSLAPTNRAIRFQCTQKVKLPEDKKDNLWYEKKYCLDLIKRKSFYGERGCVVN